MNSPILYNDPSGHRPVEDIGGGCIVKAGCSGDDERAEREYKEEQREKRKAAQAEKRLEEKMSESPTMCNCSTPRGGTVDNGVGFPYEVAQFYEGLVDVVLKMEDMTLLEKGKAVNPNPWGDFVLGGLDQVFSDLNRQDLSNFQKSERIQVAGFESGVIGLAANLGGGLGIVAGEALVPEGGGIPGYLVGQIGTTVLLQEDMDFFNQEVLFPLLDLGEP